MIGAIAAFPIAGCATRGSTQRRPGIAISIDDFDLRDDPRLSGPDRDRAIRRALAKHKVRAAGFPAGKYIDTELGPRILSAWNDDCHVLGNHSYSHRYYSGAEPAGAMADILRCEPLLSRYPSFQRLFRYPYLAEGRDAAGRDALRASLRQHGYRIAPVTIDTSDWYVDSRLVARLKQDPVAPIAPYRQYYLDHLMYRARYYDGLAHAVFGRSVDHVILLHHKLATALFLDDALTMFKRNGWRLVDAADAFAQPEMALQPDTVPAGQSLLWAVAKQKKVGGTLRYPGEDGPYEQPAMDALRL